MISHRAYDFCTDGKKDRRERCGAGVGRGRAELDKRIIDGGKRIKKETKKKIQWKRDMKEKMRHADITVTEGTCWNESDR